MRELSIQQKKEFENILKRKPLLKSDNSNLGEFLSLYFLCEVLAKKLIMYMNGKESKTFSHKEVLKALKEFGLEEIDTSVVFKSRIKEKRGENSPKQLRNEYVHTISDGSKKEIEERFLVLESNMKEFIKIFSFSDVKHKI